MKEIWKTIKNYKNYQISNLGRVKTSRGKGKLIKPMISNEGYYRITLWHNSKYKRFLLSRLVAYYFIKNTKKLPIVNHKNGNKANNKVYNLEWTTQSDNMKHAFKNKLKIMTKGEECSWSKLKTKQIHEIRTYYYLGWANMRELAERHNVNKTTIWEIIHRKIWRHV